MGERSDIHETLGLRRLINACGPMTAIGASIARPEVVRATADMLVEFVDIDDLHRKASAVIAAATGAEAGHVTACASAGITLSIAASMTGADLARVEQLPDATGMKTEVAIQMGHLTGYGAQVEQAIRLAGAKVAAFGNVVDARRYQFEAKLTERTAAALYIVSFHVVPYGQLPLDVFIETAHARGVPVIVDLANEQDMRAALAMGADIVIFSGHKFLGGPTSGLVAGRKDLVRAVFAQTRGIGRGMKVGKETIAGVIAALKAWSARDQRAQLDAQARRLTLWREALEGKSGIRLEEIPDPTGNPITRLRVYVDADTAGLAAWDFCDALAKRDPAIIVREEEVDLAYFDLDPCDLHPGEETLVSAALIEVLDQAKTGRLRSNTRPADRTSARFGRFVAWPD